MRKNAFAKNKKSPKATTAKSTLKSDDRVKTLEKELNQSKRKIKELERRVEALASTKPETQLKDTNRTYPKQSENLEIDWSRVSNNDLWNTDNKYRGGSIEKLNRTFAAICRFNDLAKKQSCPTLAVTNQSLRTISGVHASIVKDWLEENYDAVIEHHKKQGMLNSRNPKLLETYHNKKVDSEYLIDVISNHLGLCDKPTRMYNKNFAKFAKFVKLQK